MGGKIDYTPPRFQGNQWRVDIGILWVLFIFFYHFLFCTGTRTHLCTQDTSWL